MQTKYLLALNAHEKIGSQTLKKALAPFDNNPEKLWVAKEIELTKKLDKKIADLVIEAKNNFCPEAELEKLDRLDIGYITIFDKEYPRLLKEAYDCPLILYIKGNLKILDGPSIAIVGSRKYTSYGHNISYRMAKECSLNGLVIVSGLALGIDAIAHKAVVDNNGLTVGVLGCGLDRIYPVSNFHLGKEIIEKGGAIISEFPPGTPPFKQNFPARNRIIAGLTLGTLVIEAAEESGALITAYQALEYNREVFAIPGEIGAEQSVGSNKLIRNGAKMVLEVEDILSELNIEVKKSEQKARDLLPETEEEKKICKCLSKEPKLVDELISECGLNIILVNSALTSLEMKGIISNIGAGRYQLCKAK